MNNLSKVFLWSNWLCCLIPLSGLKITEFVRSGLPQTFYTMKLIFLLRNLFGVGFGNSIAPQKKQKKKFIWKSMRNRLATRQYLAFSHPKISNRCPKCNTPKTTIHILWDYPWAKMVWCQSPGILPLSFFQLPLQTWLQTNTTSATLILRHQLPWKIYFSFLCWHLWLARNERIFNNQSHS